MPGPTSAALLPVLLLPLVALAMGVNVAAVPTLQSRGIGRGLGDRPRNRNPEVHRFGAKEPGDVELFTKVMRRKQLPTKGRLDTFRYPPGGGDSNNEVTLVEVSVPQRTLTKDEVRVTEGGPGMGFVVVTIGGRRSFLVDYTVTVYGHEKNAPSDKPASAATAVAEAARGSTGAAAAAGGAQGSPDEQDDSL